MTLKEIIELKIFFDGFLRDNIFFNELKEKFPEIAPELTTARNQPNCSCVKKVKAYLISKIEDEKDFFLKILSEENITNIYKRRQSRTNHPIPWYKKNVL